MALEKGGRAAPDLEFYKSLASSSLGRDALRGLGRFYKILAREAREEETRAREKAQGYEAEVLALNATLSQAMGRLLSV
jgi:hypothetical protein